MKKLWPLFLVLFCVNSFAAQPCETTFTDLTKGLQSANQTEVLKADRIKDPMSDEPIHRYVQQMPDGKILVVEQKYCIVNNLTLTALIPRGVSTADIPKIMANSLKKSPLWKKCFPSLDTEKLLQKEFASKRFISVKDKHGSHSLSLNNTFSCKNEFSDTLLRIVNLEQETLPFQSIISIYLGVGGE